MKCLKGWKWSVSGMLLLLPEGIRLLVGAVPRLFMRGRAGLSAWCLKYIPQRISDRAVLGAFSLLSARGMSSAVIQNHAGHNAERWRELGLEGKWIEHQNRLGSLQYGKYGADYNSCEVIAVYNALLALSVNTMTFPELLSEFEHRGITAGGAFGTSPLALARYFANKGYDTGFFCGKSLQREMADPHYRVYVLTVYNDGQDLGAMVHTMCVTRENGRFTVHNDYEGTRQYASLLEAVCGYRGGRAKPICMTGIQPEKRGM